MQSRVVSLKSLNVLLSKPRRERTIPDPLLGDLVPSLESVRCASKAHILAT